MLQEMPLYNPVREGTKGGSSPPDNNKKEDRGCCDHAIMDFSEPCYWVVMVFGVVALVYAIVKSVTFFIVSSAAMIAIAAIATWRVRKLGVAYSLMESVRVLESENEKLHASVGDLENQVGKLGERLGTFRELNGLLEGTEENLEDVERRLRGLIENLKHENERYQANNLLSLFNLVDKDSNGVLDQSEINRLKEYVRAVYKMDLDLSAFDKNADNKISLEEFIDKFKHDFAEKKKARIMARTGAPPPPEEDEDDHVIHLR